MNSTRDIHAEYISTQKSITGIDTQITRTINTFIAYFL